MPFAVVGAVGAIAGAAATVYSASKASSAQNKATDAQSAAAASQSNIEQQQVNLAQEQWQQQRDIYQPAALALAKQNADNQQKITDQELSDSNYYRDLSGQLTDQAKKSWKYQDQYMQTADDYSSGKMANTMADEANADVQQAGSQQRGITQRNMARMGVNAGSGAGLALQNDNDIAQSAAGAGAQTQARRMARDKAEQMVGIAAGAGNAGFGTGLSAGGLATGAANSASGASNSGVNAFNQTNATNTNAYNGISNTFTGASGAANNQSMAGYRLGNSYNGSPFADAISGIFTGANRSGISGSSIGGLMNAFNFGTSGNNYNGTSNNMSAPNYENSFDQSDVRLKDNIRLVGRSPRGYNWYAWTWKHDGTPSSGVIAQEVREIDPDAVIEGADGYLRVDYSRV